MRWLILGLLLLTVVACYRNAPLVEDVSQAPYHNGHTVRVEGTLLNTKLALSIDVKGWSVYCVNAKGWDQETKALMSAALSKKEMTVIAIGNLEVTDEFKATLAPDGAISAGTSGNDWILRKCELRERY
jgi:hypothetical protein